MSNNESFGKSLGGNFLNDSTVEMRPCVWYNTFQRMSFGVLS